MAEIWEDVWKPTFCSQCPGGPPCLVKVHLVNGVAVNIGPNYEFTKLEPWQGRPCVQGYGLIQKHYDPHRLKTPVKRTNPKKGRGEDPGFVEIGWDEALDTITGKLKEIRQKGLLDKAGYPRLAFAEGSNGSPPSYWGTMPALFGRHTGGPFNTGAWGPADIGLGMSAGIKCNRTQHCFGEMWQKAFCHAPDLDYCKYQIILGLNTTAVGGGPSARNCADARVRGMKVVHIDPVLPAGGATADEWIPIKPGTDAALLYAMLHVVLYEMDWHKVCDTPFLKKMTNSPYLVAPNGYFLRDSATKVPLVWDAAEARARPFDAPGIKDFALEGEYVASGLILGPDGREDRVENVRVKPAFQLLLELAKNYTPEWATGICEVRPETIRRLAREFVENAMVGATIEMDGVEMPLRPVAIMIGRTLATGLGSYHVVWAMHVLEILVGALEVPGSDLGSWDFFAGPVVRTPDGFMTYPFGPTDKEHWIWPPMRRDGSSNLTPLAYAFDGPQHLAWKWMLQPPENWPAPTIPEVYISYKFNPAITQFDSQTVMQVLSQIPFHVHITYTLDETAWFADIVLPQNDELETLHMFPLAGTGFQDWHWDYHGWMLRQPVVKREGNTMDATDLTTELADRLGLLADYNERINNGSYFGIRLKGTPHELKPDKKYTTEELHDRFVRVASRQLTQGKEEHGLDWFKEHGALLAPFPRLKGIAPPVPEHVLVKPYLRPWYLYPTFVAQNMRFELPYQERLKRIGEELGARLKELNVHWWDKQVEEYQPMPPWFDYRDAQRQATAQYYDKDPKDYPLFLVSVKSMQYSFSSNITVPWMAEAASHVQGHHHIQINARTAEELGIEDNDLIWVESPLGRIKGRAKLRQGIRPDVVQTTHVHGHWVTHFAKDLGVPNPNLLAPILVGLTDASGGSKDHIRVRVYKA